MPQRIQSSFLRPFYKEISQRTLFYLSAFDDSRILDESIVRLSKGIKHAFFDTASGY